MREEKYLKFARKYLDLSSLYYDEYNPKNPSEVIFENNFKYEISLNAYAFFYSNYLHGFNQNSALFARKIIEDYYLYKLKDTDYLTHSNFKLFKIASYKSEVGTRALHEISEEFKLPVNVIKSRMFDNDFWAFPIRLNSFEHLFDLDYEGAIKPKTNELLKKLYKAYGIYLHYSNEISISMNEFNSSIAVINQIVREVIGKDYDKVKISSKESKEINQEFEENMINMQRNLLDALGDTFNAEFFDNCVVKPAFVSIFTGLCSKIYFYLSIYCSFYFYNKKAIGLYLNKVFIEELSYYFALLEIDMKKDADSIYLLSNLMTNQLVNSIINEKDLKESLLNSRKFNDYYRMSDFKEDEMSKFLDKYMENPYKLINSKYNTFSSFVSHLLRNFTKKEELNYIYKEACSIGHSCGLMQNHEFNYKKTFNMLLDVIDNYLRYYSIIVVSRNFNDITQKKNKEALNESIENINNVFKDIFKLIKDTFNLEN